MTDVVECWYKAKVKLDELRRMSAGYFTVEDLMFLMDPWEGHVPLDAELIDMGRRVEQIYAQVKGGGK